MRRRRRREARGSRAGGLETVGGRRADEGNGKKVE